MIVKMLPFTGTAAFTLSFCFADAIFSPLSLAGVSSAFRAEFLPLQCGEVPGCGIGESRTERYHRYRGYDRLHSAGSRPDDAENYESQEICRRRDHVVVFHCFFLLIIFLFYCFLAASSLRLHNTAGII
jgi:hypothetical protein